VRFALVFCGSLVGLALLFSTLGGDRLLEAGVVGIEPGGIELIVNPVLFVLVAGALSLSYYVVFECGADGAKAS